MVLGARGEPLDIGRASSTVPTAIRRAVIVRDGGCAYPGRFVPARWCDIHHIVHWADHGPTSLTNCVALCGRHHRLVHHSHWRIGMTTGIPEFHPPPWLAGPPCHNPLHTTPDLIRTRPIAAESCAHADLPSCDVRAAGFTAPWPAVRSDEGVPAGAASPTTRRPPAAGRAPTPRRRRWDAVLLRRSDSLAVLLRATPRTGVTPQRVISTAVTKTGQLTTGSDHGAQHSP